MPTGYYILATSALADDRTRVLKDGDTFAVFNRFGDAQTIGLGEHGVYHDGTRFLSRLELTIGDTRPMLLSSTVTDDNVSLEIDLMNPDISADGEVTIRREKLHLTRTKFLWKKTCHERLSIRSYGEEPIEVTITFRFESDFDDIFEVRGARRERRGKSLAPAVGAETVSLGYDGLDGVVRRARFEFAPRPTELSSSHATYVVELQPGEEKGFFVTLRCEENASVPSSQSFGDARTESHSALATRVHHCEIYSSNESFNELLKRSMSDLNMMTTETPHGPYPYAGVPWFNTVFGRDGLITAMECLWFNPPIAGGVLRLLAATQARRLNEAQDAEPGKILHEMRGGEMASLGEIPFGSYYGTADASALFVMLAGAYYERTGDRALIEEIWPNIELALDWIDTYGDSNGDGVVDYIRRSTDGLTHHGWKDFGEAVFHADGTPAEPPIALCEVQAYVYAAKLRAADLARMLHQAGRARELRSQARRLKTQFERSFWSDDLSIYVLALARDGSQCRVRASNAGHAMFVGIASDEHARRTAETLMGPAQFSGWGVRTVAATEALYNQMAYHNGSIWPHALIAYGLARYGFRDAVIRVFEGLFEASRHMDLQRLPELFCGFERRPGEGPLEYPLANAPQSWAAASIFFVLQACLGLSVVAPQEEIRFSHPVLPEFLEWLWIKNLTVGTSSVDLHLERHRDDVGITVERREGPAHIVVIK